MDKAKKSRARVEKVGVAWNRKMKNGKDGLKISINKEIFIAYKNTKKGDNIKAPDYVVVKFIDSFDKEEIKEELKNGNHNNCNNW